MDASMDFYVIWKTDLCKIYYVYLDPVILSYVLTEYIFINVVSVFSGFTVT